MLGKPDRITLNKYLFSLKYLFLVVLGLHCYAWAFSSCGEWGLLSSCVARASHCGGFFCCRAWAPGTWASVLAAPGLGCCEACGIFLDQGSNPCPLHWQADSYALFQQGSPRMTFCDSLHRNNLLHSTFSHATHGCSVSVPLFTSPFILWKESSFGVWAVSLLTLICLCPVVPERKSGQWGAGRGRSERTSIHRMVKR